MTFSQLHFLVVDDQMTVRRIVIALLELLGHSAVSEAEDGAHALELLREQHVGGSPVNFVITDWNMPVMDGLSLVRAMRSSEDLHDVPVLMISSEFGHQNLIAAKVAGVDEYISKLSLSVDLLGEALNRILIAKQHVL